MKLNKWILTSSIILVPTTIAGTFLLANNIVEKNTNTEKNINTLEREVKEENNKNNWNKMILNDQEKILAYSLSSAFMFLIASFSLLVIVQSKKTIRKENIDLIKTAELNTENNVDDNNNVDGDNNVDDNNVANK